MKEYWLITYQCHNGDTKKPGCKWSILIDVNPAEWIISQLTKYDDYAIVFALKTTKRHFDNWYRK